MPIIRCTPLIGIPPWGLVASFDGTTHRFVYRLPARITELKDHLSRYLDHVKGGGSVLVFDRDQPVAQIVPIQSGRHNTGELGERLGRLERRGIVRRGAGGLPDWLGRRKPPKLRGSVLQDLLKERAGGW